MKNKKYTQKRIKLLIRRRGIFINNNLINMKDRKVINIEDKKLIIGIIGKRNKKITQEQINTIRQDINNIQSPTQIINLGGGKITKYFEIKIKMKPNKVITNKGILVRMGKGKGKIKTKAIYILKDMVCIELKQKDKNNKKIRNLIKNINNNKIIGDILKKIRKKYTYFKIKTNILI